MEKISNLEQIWNMEKVGNEEILICEQKLKLNKFEFEQNLDLNKFGI
jgi:hypothetical protein